MTDPSPAPSSPPPVPGLLFQQQVKSVSTTLMPQSIAIMGVFKVGKTTLAASAARIKRFMASNKKVLILEAEAGTASIAEDYPEVEMFSIGTFGGFNKAIDELLTKQHDYGICIIDTFDAFADYGVSHFVDGKDDTRAGYGHLKKWLEELVWRLHKSPILFIFLFHEETEKDEKTGVRYTTFKLPGSAKKEVGKIFDIIGRLEIKDDSNGVAHRYLQLGPATGVSTGSRYERKLPNSMVDPTMDQIYDLILATPTSSTNQN